jgi:hypothetical protein
MNMILTSTTGGLDAKAIEPFFYSLRLSGCQDPVVVFTSNISKECQDLLAKYEATAEEFDYRGMPAVSRLSQKLPWAWTMVTRYYRTHRLAEKDFRYLYLNCSRFYHYQQYLASLTDKPKFVFQADIRDIVFQTNPFSYPFAPGFSVATECQSIIASKGAVKQLWQAAGLIATCRMLLKPIINGGTLMADFETATKHIGLQTAHLDRVFFWALFEGLDQALAAYFAYNNMIRPLHVFNNWNGPFLTLANEVVLPANKNQDGYLCNKDGTVIPVVHQYDRVKRLYQKGEPVPPCWKHLAQESG